MASLLGLLIEEVEWVWNWKKMRSLLNTLSRRCLTICYILLADGFVVWSSAVIRVEILIYQSLAQMEIDAWKK